VIPSDIILTVLLLVSSVWIISTMHLINQGMPKHRRMLRVFAPIEQLIPKAPSPAICKKFVHIITVNASVAESKLNKCKALVRYKTVR
jgi:hypothetical protein